MIILELERLVDELIKIKFSSATILIINLLSNFSKKNVKVLMVVASLTVFLMLHQSKLNIFETM